ncbi:MAG: ATP-binding protein [Planctomycetota bacterium]
MVGRVARGVIEEDAMTTDDPGPRSRLLLVEDNAIDVFRIRRMMRADSWGFDIVPASSIAEALAHRQEPVPTIILLDLSLPDGQGMESFEKVRACFGDVPIVILSGNEDESLAKDAVRQGAQDYLVKGAIDAQGLRRAIQYAIERHRIEMERTSLELSLLQSRKLEAIGQLAAGIAHEINTPTQFVSDNTRFLSDALRDITSMVTRLRGLAATEEPVPAAALGEILAAADVDYLIDEIPKALEQSTAGLQHIARIVQAMKEFSHPPTKEKSPVDLNAALETTIVVSANAWKYVAEVKTDLDPDLPAVKCVPGEINQVFLNILVNAAQAIEEVADAEAGHKGRITVTSRTADDGFVEIRIADTGCGIPTQHRERIFDPFFTTKEIGKGTGQGLALAYNAVVNVHGGSISFTTEEGKGTCFLVRLPIEPREAPSPAGGR